MYYLNVHPVQRQPPHPKMASCTACENSRRLEYTGAIETVHAAWHIVRMDCHVCPDLNIRLIRYAAPFTQQPPATR
jgi:hypothetical protein